MGTKDSEFIEVNEKTQATHMLTCGHGEGELWGLAVHPQQDKFVTASDDGTVRYWDIVNKVSIGSILPHWSLGDGVILKWNLQTYVTELVHECFLGNWSQVSTREDLSWEVNFGWGNDLVLLSNKTLPVPVLTQIYVTIWHH